jgi:rhodanese-related sulfurtransferase
VGLAEIVDLLAHSHVAEVTVLSDEYLGSRDEIELVSARELNERLEQGKVVPLDVRPESEFRAGHIAGAVSAPLEQLESVASSLPKRRDVVAYCRGPYCVYSYEALEVLRPHGIRAQRLDGGFSEWLAAGLPVERDQA